MVASAVSLLAQTQTRPPQLPTEITALRFNTGQSVTPYFEGWIRNADGTFDMVFGYFNRNYQQEFAIPAGPDNIVEPFGPDAGQPTYFQSRRQRFIFRVRVPAEFGKKEVVWTITANGRTERGYGTLLPEQEITERVVMTNGNFDPGHDDPNKAPAISIAPLPALSANQPVTLTAMVTDDGLPKARQAAATPTPSTPAASTNPFQAQVNSSGGGRPRGLTVTWLQYSGPAKVAFEHSGAIAVAAGQAVTTARFPVPGTYKLIATATDPGRLATKREVIVTILRGTSTSGR